MNNPVRKTTVAMRVPVGVANMDVYVNNVILHMPITRQGNTYVLPVLLRAHVASGPFDLWTQFGGHGLFAIHTLPIDPPPVNLDFDWTSAPDVLAWRDSLVNGHASGHSPDTTFDWPGDGMILTQPNLYFSAVHTGTKVVAHDWHFQCDIYYTTCQRSIFDYERLSASQH